MKKKETFQTQPEGFTFDPFKDRIIANLKDRSNDPYIVKKVNKAIDYANIAHQRTLVAPNRTFTSSFIYDEYSSIAAHRLAMQMHRLHHSSFICVGNVFRIRIKLNFLLVGLQRFFAFCFLFHTCICFE